MIRTSFAYVWLWSETEDENILPTPIEYSLTNIEVSELKIGIREKVQLLQFSDMYHHTEDIIKLQIKL